ncbi:hypothetical protein BWQ93_01770 [Sphingopyxis sp. QXT-31]|uniref:hypothetical protein n=1 Tax=Sphingopyxis sp. QXT-31 TaxID=1357916 RepID=UPI0009798280|nr:hypothetical protein [Sphingopyxis sp. QXT-31]APZ97359.1 hypothetical protein BWQ93_01770 [Sphingopyxis sp. QXT-31]
MNWGRWAARLSAAVPVSMLLGVSGVAQPSVIDDPAPPVVAASIATEPDLVVAQSLAAVAVPAPDSGPTATLAAGTSVLLMLDEELSTTASSVGDRFGVTVLFDVYDLDRIVIPQGTKGFGEVTFAANKGGFGKPGILGISLRHLDLDGRQVALSGRYREEGANKNGATAATWFAVGVFSGFIHGKPGVIPRGRELKARTGETISYAIAPLPVAGVDVAAFAAGSAFAATSDAVSPPISE